MHTGLPSGSRSWPLPAGLRSIPATARSRSWSAHLPVFVPPAPGISGFPARARYSGTVPCC